MAEKESSVGPGRGADMRVRGELLWNLISRDLKSRYKGSVLGFLWTVLSPLFMALIYIFFLRLLAGRAISSEGVLVGVFAWQFTAQSVQGGLMSVTGHSNLVKKVFFPRELLPLSGLLANLIAFGLSLVVLLILLAGMTWGHGGWPGWALAGLAPVVVWHALLNLSLAFFLAAANVYFRDTQHLVGLGLSAWFFVSPVMYDLSFVQRFAADRTWMLPWYELNPMTGLMGAYRSCLTGAPFPAGDPWIWAGLAWPLVLLPLSIGVYRRAQKWFSDLL